MALHATAKTPSLAHPGYIAGNWYQAIEGASVGAGAAIAANTIKLLPFVVYRPITVQGLAARVTTLSGGGNFQLAIYGHNAATGRPTSTALCSTGNISTAATGTIGAAVTANRLLQPGLYWMAINQDNSTAVYQTLTAGVAQMTALIGSATLGNIASGAGTASLGLSVSQAFGTWPDLTSASFTENTTLVNALVDLQAA
jgi:hypothetical protein